MSLASIAKQLKANGYDPRKDKVNGNQHLPEGDYIVVLKGAEGRITDTSWESINYAFEVRDPDSPFNGRMQYVSMGTLETWTTKQGVTMDLSNMVEKTVKFFQKALVLADDNMRVSDLEDIKTMADALNRQAVGMKFILSIGEYTKRDKSTGYNYDLDLPQEQGNPFAREKVIKDDDLPF